MTGLINGEFEFRGQKFGSSRSGYPLKEGGFSVSAMTFRDQDQDNPNGRGRVFGRDAVIAATYSFDMHVIEEESYAGWQAASRSMSSFRNVWHGSPTHGSPRAVDELLMWHGDRVGLVYGRARNYSEDRERLRKGFGGITCDFASVDDLVYDENLSDHVLSLVASVPGGLKAPLVAPLVGTSSGESRHGFFDVGGDIATPAIIRFHGPVTSPRLTVLGEWTVGLNVSLSIDEYVEIDSRMWSRSVIRNGWSSAAGALTQDTAALDQLVLPPGTNEMVFMGIDATNNATATLSWRNARHSV